MANCRNIILKLKEIREERGLSYNDIVTLVEKNGSFISRSSIQRVFAEGSEEMSFKYEETIKPIANALLDIDNLEDEDDENTKSMKVLLRFKDSLIGELKEKIKELECKIANEKIKYHEKMESERATWGRSIEFLKEQVAYKDKRMDLLLQAVQDKDTRYDELLKIILACPARVAYQKGCDDT